MMFHVWLDKEALLLSQGISYYGTDTGKPVSSWTEEPY